MALLYTLNKQDYLPIGDTGESTFIDDDNDYHTKSQLGQDAQKARQRWVNNRTFQIITGIILVLNPFLLAGLLVLFKSIRNASMTNSALVNSLP